MFFQSEIKVKNLGRSFVATPMSLLHIFCKIIFTKISGSRTQCQFKKPSVPHPFEKGLTSL